MNEHPDTPTLGVQRVTALLAQNGHPHRPRLLDAAAHTARQAADALCVNLGQIAKSIVFQRTNHNHLSDADAAVLVVTSGDLRVDEKKVHAIVCAAGGQLTRANAEFVKAKTGFSIGGVSPVAHVTPTITLIDRQLFRFDQIWAAAGHPSMVFALTPDELVRLTGAPVQDVTLVTQKGTA